MNKKTKAKPTVKKPVKKSSKTPAKKPGLLPENYIQIILGPYGTQSEADQERLQFLHPNVFSYRSAIFPVPQNFRVTPVVLAAGVVKMQDNKLYPFGLDLTIRVDGEPEKAKSWIVAFRNRARQTIVGSRM